MRFNGRRLKQAREILGLTQEELGKKTNLDQSFISLIEQNAREPSLEATESIYLTTGFPKSFFERPDAPDFPLGSLLFRKKGKLSSARAATARQAARLVVETYLELDGRALSVRVPQTGDSEPRSAAQLARSTLGYSPDGPIKGLMSRLEKAGVIILRLPNVSQGFDAFSTWLTEDQRRPIIVLGPAQTGDRDRATLAHELGHLVMHSSFLGSISQVEAEAKEFSGEFLLPEDDLRQEWKTGVVTLTRLAEFKRRWGVSMQFALWRLQVGGLISPQQKSYWRGKMHKQGWLIEEPVPIAPEFPCCVKMALEGAQADRSKRVVAMPPGLFAKILEANSHAQPVGREESFPGPAPVGGSKKRASSPPSKESDQTEALAPVLSFRR